jgi:hypothetical protein
MSRSNAPLALSVVSLTVPGNVDTTFKNITRFDDDDFGFNHNRTWATLPAALQGTLDPQSVAASLLHVPARVRRCITALCEAGRRNPVQTFKFRDFPSAGLKESTSIDWDPAIKVKVKASCWYMENDRPIIPALQPRKEPLSRLQLSAYFRLIRQAYLQGDWVDGQPRIYDLSGQAECPVVSVIDESMVPSITDSELALLVSTFVEAKRMADVKRTEKKKDVTVNTPMDELLGLK